jgi:hypothetical protein
MKGQTAWQYLMTYGWAVLVVIVVVLGLYYMGVFTYGGETTIEEDAKFRELCIRLCSEKNSTMSKFNTNFYCYCRKYICEDVVVIDGVTFQRDCDLKFYRYEVAE